MASRKLTRASLRSHTVLHRREAANRRGARVEMLERRLLMATFSVLNTSDTGAGSLRQAITDANGAAGVDTINFAIAGAGVHTISPTSQLPDITESVTINGYSQSGASANTLANGNNAVLLIELEGSSAGGGARGLTLGASNVTIRGLVINRYPFAIQANSGTANHVIAGNFFGTNATGTASAGGFQSFGVHLNGATDSTIGGTSPADRNLFAAYGAGISLQDAPRNTVQGNYLGTNAAGTAAISTSSINITSFTDGSSDNLIGGTAPGARNLISGNSSTILISGGGQDNTIQGNYMGTDVTGLTALGGGGINAGGTRNLLIGGTAAGAGNVISGNSGVGISLSTTGATIQGNFIGVGADGTTALGNGSSGVHIGSIGTSPVVIGGLAAGAANVIANNANLGIGLSTGAGAGHTILSNSIYNNLILGIDLGADQTTANDTLDPDTGANNLQNFPVLDKPTVGASLTTISGTLNSLANTAFTVQLFTSDNFRQFDGAGQGKTLLATLTVNTDGSGNGTFTTDIANGTVPQGTLLTASATNNATGDTSEFAKIVAVTAFTVTNTNATGAGSLDNAVKGAELVDGLDNIFFNIPGAGVHTITIPGLYQITGPVVIDGYTQPGSSANTLAVGDDSVHLIEISGTQNYFANFTGGGSTVRGLVLNQWQGVAALRITGPLGGNFVEGNFIGPRPDGSTVTFGNSSGINVEGSPNNRIGGTLPAQRNVISGNSFGILYFQNLAGQSLAGNVVQGNYMGTNAAGTAAITSGFAATSTAINVAVGGPALPSGILIGGSAPGAGNVISGNRSGISVTGTNTNVSIQGNFIGTDATGTQPLGNLLIGMDLGGGEGGVPSGNSVGGLNPGEGNVIAFNGTDGDTLEAGGIGLFRNGSSFAVGVPVLGNRIYGNNGLAIDADDDGPTANDFQDVDNGANNLQNYPLITSSVQNGPNIDIVGSLNSTPNTTFRIEFFTVSSTNQTVLGSASVTTDANGDAAISQSFAGTLGAELVTATATDPNSNTSEYFPVNIPVNTSGTLSVSPVSIGEAAGTVNVTIQRSSGSTGAVSVDVTTSTGTASSADFTAVTTTVNFADGETSKTVTITIANDTDVESTEGFAVTLSNVSGGATLGASAATVSIIDDDTPAGPTVGFSPITYVVSEAGGSTTITIVRSDGTGAATVDFTTADGTATAGVDYTGVTQTVSFADGQTTQTVVIPILQNTLSEPTETVSLSLSNFSAGTVAGGNGTLSIADDDRAPLIVTGTLTKSGKSRMQLFDARTGNLLRDFRPFNDKGNAARVALADVTGDGTPDIITALSEKKSRVRIFDGVTGAIISGPLGDFVPFNLKGGSYIAAGDLNNDGRAEVVVGLDKRKHAEVHVYDGATGQLLTGSLGSFVAFQATKKVYGAMPAIGDVNGDGSPDLVIGTAHGSTQVRVFSGLDGSLLQDFFAYDPSNHTGIFVAAGDLDGSGRAQIITAARRKTAGVRVFADGVLNHEFAPASSRFRDGFSVAAVDFSGDGLDDIVVGIGRKTGNHVSIFQGTDRTELFGFRALSSKFNVRVHVAAD